MSKRIQPVCIANDATEDSLIVAEKHERELAGDGYGGAELEASAIPVVVGGFEHCSRC
jgi:hypothetical protein